MRQIFRPEVLWRDVIPLAVFAIIVLLIFIIATRDIHPDADLAVSWTMRALGGWIALVATFGLLWRALHSDALELQFSFVLALLAGLLLVNVQWSLAIALGALGVALIVREIWAGGSVARRTSDVGYVPPSERPMP